MAVLGLRVPCIIRNGIVIASGSWDNNSVTWLDPVDFLNVLFSLPQVAEFVDERPEEVKQMEAFRSSAKWKLLGGEFQQ